MADSWLTLSREDQAEALEVASAQTGRPPHLLEKDIWVVWTLSAIYESALAEKLTFKGGTSLSKVYKIIDRFSEDIDLTCDIREVVPELLRDGNPIPDSPSQAKKITARVRERLPHWIESEVVPILLSALQRDGVQATEIKAEIPRISEFGLVQFRRKHHKTYINQIVSSLSRFKIELSMFKT